jgi:catalase
MMTPTLLQDPPHERATALLENLVLGEKITHADHERIPERIVHARGARARRYFQVYESLGPLPRVACPGWLLCSGTRQ